MTPEYHPRPLITRNKAGEWKEYMVIELSCTATDDGRSMIIYTHPGETVSVPVRREFEAFGYLIWSRHEGPLTYDFNCTYRLDKTLILTGIVFDGEYYPFS